MMKLFLALLVLTGCASCTSASDSGVVSPIQAVRQHSKVAGEGEFGSLYIGPFPFTYPIRWRGNADVTLQYPQLPHVIIDGDNELVVEPISPEAANMVQQDVAAGRIVIRKHGQRAGLSPVGTIRSSS